MKYKECTFCGFIMGILSLTIIGLIIGGILNIIKSNDKREMRLVNLEWEMHHVCVMEKYTDCDKMPNPDYRYE